MFRARLGFALVVTTQRPVVVGTISQACVMSPVFSHVVTRVPDTGGASPLVQVVSTVMKIVTVWGVSFSNITRCECAIWRCKRRYGHSHSHNTGDCEGEKTLAEFLHDVFFHSERNLYRVCFGTDMFRICTPMLEALAVLCKIPQHSLKTRKNCASDRKSCVNANVQCHSGAGSR